MRRGLLDGGLDKRAGATSCIASLNSPGSKTITSISTRSVSEGAHKRVESYFTGPPCQRRLSPEGCWLERIPVPGVGMGSAYDLLAVARDEVCPVDVGAVVSGAAGNRVRDRRVVERVHDVVAGATGDLVARIVEGRAVVHEAAALAAGHGVPAEGAGDLVVARPAGDQVVAGTAGERVGARAEQRGITREQVVAPEPGYG